MAIFQNTKFLELENQVSQLTAERNNLQIILDGLRKEGVTLGKYEQMAQEIRRLKNEVAALNGKTADYFDEIKNYKLQLQFADELAEKKYRQTIDELKAQIGVPIHNARGAGRKPMASADDISFILNLYNQGDGITSIFKALDGRFSKSTIYRIIKKSLSQN